jgi:hypothetical protein
MGIGIEIIEHLHAVMKQDFHESDILFHELITFFHKHGSIHLKIYDIDNIHARLFQTDHKQERIQDINSLFPLPKD